MALQGTLDTFSLPDVLRLLATTGKTGCLHVDGDRGRGSVWLDDGAVVAATAERALGTATIDEVIFEIMRFSRGSFNFAADERAPQESQQSKDVEKTLRRAGQLLDEWRDLEAVVPTLSHRVALAPELTVDQVTIDAPRWQALVAIAAGRSVGELAQSLDLGELAVSRTVSDLVELGVAIIQPPGAARAPSSGGRRTANDVASRPTTGDSPRRAPTTGPTQAVATAPTNGKLESRREPRDRDRATKAPAASDNGRPGWRDDPKPPVETAPKPRPSKAAASRSARTRRTGPTPTTVPPSARPLGSPARNGQTLTGTAVGSPLVPPTSPFPSATPPGVGPAPAIPTDRGLTPPVSPSAPTAPVPTVPDTYRGPILPPTLDTGRLGPSPLTQHDTGQIPSIGASALPPDLSWAAEDHEPPPPAPAPGAVRGSTGRLMATPTPPPLPSRAAGNGRSDAEMAHHVAAMSPDARSVVEATIGRGGGGPGGMPTAGASQEQILNRSQLLSFLSSVRQ
ncbi:MAG: DUF4388 domain-containing protein [Acidimicrobiales bacterium]